MLRADPRERRGRIKATNALQLGIANRQAREKTESVDVGEEARFTRDDFGKLPEPRSWRRRMHLFTCALLIPVAAAWPAAREAITCLEGGEDRLQEGSDGVNRHG